MKKMKGTYVEPPPTVIPEFEFEKRHRESKERVVPTPIHVKAAPEQNVASAMSI